MDNPVNEFIMKTNRLLITLLIPSLAACCMTASAKPPKGFTPLFDGESMEGWYAQPGITQEVWKIDPKTGTIGRDVKSGYLWTQKTYGDFVLQLEFKMSRNCNSGLFFRTNPDDPVQAGFEIQLYDVPDKSTIYKNSTGALYDAQAPTSIPLNDINKWNSIKLHVEGNSIKIWINDVLVNSVDLSKWTTAGMNPDGTENKFKTALNDLPKTGHIGFQDHGHNIWFRNVFIKEL